MQSRDEVLNNLNVLYNGVSTIESLTDRENQIIAQIKNLDKEIGFEQERQNKGLKQSGLNVGKGKNAAGTVVLIIGAIIFAIVFVLSRLLYALIMDADSSSAWAAKTVGNALLVLVVIIFAIIFFVVRGATGAIGNSIVKTSANAVPDAQNKINNYRNQIENLMVQIPKIESQIAITYTNAEPLIKSFPPDYCYAEAISRVIFFIKNSRADSMKEALNMYEDEVYKDKMLAEQKKQTAYAKISAAANIQTAYNTGQIAKNTADIARNTADIANSERIQAANSDAIRNYAAQTEDSARQAAKSAADFNKMYKEDTGRW